MLERRAPKSDEDPSFLKQKIQNAQCPILETHDILPLEAIGSHWKPGQCPTHPVSWWPTTSAFDGAWGAQADRSWNKREDHALGWPTQVCWFCFTSRARTPARSSCCGTYGESPTNWTDGCRSPWCLDKCSGTDMVDIPKEIPVKMVHCRWHTKKC